jgi:hypothetical protein
VSDSGNVPRWPAGSMPDSAMPGFRSLHFQDGDLPGMIMEKSAGHNCVPAWWPLAVGASLAADSMIARIASPAVPRGT